MERRVFTTLVIIIVIAVVGVVWLHNTNLERLTVMETYNNYIDEDLFRNVDDSYSDDPKASYCFDRFKMAQELGIVNANKLYSTAKKEIPKKKFMKILADLVTAHGIRDRNNNIIDNQIRTTPNRYILYLSPSTVNNSFINKYYDINKVLDDVRKRDISNATSKLLFRLVNVAIFTNYYGADME